MDIEIQLLRRLRAEARRRGVSVKDLLQGFIRRGLEERPSARRPYRLPTYAMGAPRVPLDKALALASTFEDQEIARELALRK